MPLAARRMRRAAVIGPAPVVRAAGTVATVAVVAHGVDRRGDRRKRTGGTTAATAGTERPHGSGRARPCGRARPLVCRPRLCVVRGAD